MIHATQLTLNAIVLAYVFLDVGDVMVSLIAKMVKMKKIVHKETAQNLNLNVMMVDA
jgi:hypothetical protein